MKIQTWHQGFLVKLLYMVLPSLELTDERIILAKICLFKQKAPKSCWSFEISYVGYSYPIEYG